MPASTANNMCDSLQGYCWAIQAATRVQVLLYCAHAVVVLGLRCLEGLVKPSVCWLFELLHPVLVLFCRALFDSKHVTLHGHSGCLTMLFGCGFRCTAAGMQWQALQAHPAAWHERHNKISDDITTSDTDNGFRYWQ